MLYSQVADRFAQYTHTSESFESLRDLTLM